MKKRPNFFLNRKKAEPYIETLVRKRPRNFLNEKTLGSLLEGPNEKKAELFSI
jgi:hypothetical protein